MESFIGVIATFLVTQSPQWCMSKYGSTDTVAAVARWLDRMFPALLTRSWQANFRNPQAYKRLDEGGKCIDYCHLRNRSSLKAERIDSSIHNLKKPAVLVAVLPAPRVIRQPYNWLACHDRNPSINWWLPAYVCVCDAGPVFSRSTLNKVTEK